MSTSDGEPASLRSSIAPAGADFAAAATLEKEIQRLASAFFGGSSLLSENFGTPSLIAVAQSPQASTPYFMDLVGPPPGAAAAGESVSSAVQVPAAPAASTYEFRTTLVPDLGSSVRPFDPNAVKRDFPILQERVHGRPLIWLDNAATTQKPQAVIDRLSFYYEHENSNVHRAAHTLAARSTDAYEAARGKVRRFLNAPLPKEIVFVRGATEAINLVAQSWGRRNIGPGDEIVITWLEHHANIVPWQQLCGESGARLRVAPVDKCGQIILEQYERLLGPRTRLVSFAHVSNALGTVLPAREMVEMAHRHGAVVLIDGAQAVSHMPVDVQALDCGFYAFSGHKVFAPTGIGVLFGKANLLETMPPWQGGGNMIADVTFDKTVYQSAPGRFEAGTGSIADAVALGAAVDYVSAIGLETVSRYEHELLVYASERLAKVPGLTMIGTAAEKAGVLSFVIDGVRTEDVGAALDQEGIAARAGHHCAQPIHRLYGLESTVRASLALYNTHEDIDALATALLRLTGRVPLRFD
jgi:cysteine desulfurase/selenocysteine lyase